MTKKEACEFLGGLRRHTKKAKKLEEQIEIKRFALLPGAIRYDKDRVNTSPRDQMLEGFAEIDELERQLIDENRECYRAIIDISRAILQIPEGPERRFLLGYYIHMKNIYQLSAEFNYSLRHTYRLQRKAMEVFMEVQDGRDRNDN